MAEILRATAVGALSFGLAAVVFAMAALWTLRRRNRIDRRTPTDAPLCWLWSPGRCARLHRRLRMAGMNLRARPSGMRQEAAELLAYACVVDHRLVTAARTPAGLRLRQLAPLAGEVVLIEHLAACLCGACIPSPAVSPVHPLGRLAARVHALEDLRPELDAAVTGSPRRGLAQRSATAL